MDEKVKNIVILTMSLLAIMVVSTILVISFNFTLGYNTDVNNDDVATAIAAVAFGIALLLRYYYNNR